MDRFVLLPGSLYQEPDTGHILPVICLLVTWFPASGVWHLVLVAWYMVARHMLQVLGIWYIDEAFSYLALTMYQLAVSRYRVPNTWYLVLVPGAWSGPCAGHMIPGTRFRYQVLGLVPGTRYAGFKLEF